MPFKSEAQRAYLYANHPEIAERFSEETPENADLPQYMNDGGFAGNYDVDLGSSSTLRGMPYTPPLPPAPKFDPMAGLPPTPVPTPATAAPAPASAPVAPMPSPQFDELTPYLAQQRAALDRFGPDKQMEVEREILKRRSGIGQIAGNAMTGLADALMQGVARAGPSNFQQNLQNRNDKTEAGIRGAFEKAQTGNQAKIKQEMELAQMDPASPLSRLAQRSASPLLKSLGLSDDEIKNMPASLIGEAQTKQLSLEEIRSKAELARALQENTAAYQSATLGHTREKEKAEAEEKVKERRTGAAKDLLTKSGAVRVMGIPIPGTSDVSSKDKKAALNVLREGMAEPLPGQANFEPDVIEYARTHNITPQAAQIQKERRMRGQ